MKKLQTIRLRFFFKILKKKSKHFKSTNLNLNTCVVTPEDMNLIKLEELKKTVIEQTKFPLFCFVIIKKTGTAVYRNRCRRRVKECIRALQNQHNIKPGLYSFFLKKPCFFVDFQILYEEIKTLMKKFFI